MIINNFSLGIIGLVLCLLSYSFIGPAIVQANNFLTTVIQAIVKTGALPALAILNEPAKVLFLNNVIDQGIYYPLGMQQSLAAGKSIFFMVASNPGAGLGLLLAYSFFGKGQAKKTAPGAIIIHFFGGIHEIYFPYVLMKPITILGMIAGSASGIVTFSLFNVGLVAGPSPGSIFSYLALTPKGNFVGVIAGVLVATAVSFVVNSLLIKASKDTDDEELAKSQEKSKAMKQEGKDILAGTKEQGAVSTADINNYTVLPQEYQEQYLYTYILAIYTQIYLKKINFEFRQGTRIKQTRKEFIKFTQTLWINEVTSEDTGSLYFQYLKDVLELNSLYFETKNKYDILYTELNIEKNNKINVAVSALLIVALIINAISILLIFK